MVTRSFWIRMLGPAIAVIVLARLDLQELARALRDVEIAPLLMALLLAAPLLVMKAWRWHAILIALGSSIERSTATWLYVAAAGAAAVTPGGAGDFVKGLAPETGSARMGLLASTIDRLCDVVFTALMVVLAVGAWWMHPPPLSTPGAIALATVSPRSMWTKLRTTQLDTPTVMVACLTTVTAGLLSLARFVLLAEALGLSLTWQESLVAFALNTGVAALPISVAGLGTRDAVLVAFFGARGLAPETAVALATLCFSLYLFNAILGAGAWALQPARRSGS